MAARAEEAGYSAICMTLDAKIKPKRERNLRNSYVGPVSPNYAQLDSHSWKFAADAPAGPSDIRDVAADWSDLDWFASTIRLPVVVKGIMAGEDGRLSAENGAKAVIVSNHGGRYLDTTPATIEMLSEVVAAVDSKAPEVYLSRLSFAAVGSPPHYPVVLVAYGVAGIPEFRSDADVGAVPEQPAQLALLDFVTHFGAKLKIVPPVIDGPGAVGFHQYAVLGVGDKVVQLPSAGFQADVGHANHG